jgi:hypothetical protein
MQDKLKDILKKFSFGNAEPDKDWKKIFAFFVILVIVAFAWNVYFYFGIQSKIEAAEASQPVVSGTINTEREDRLRNTKQAYEARAAESRSIVSGDMSAIPGSVLEDPSRP